MVTKLYIVGTPIGNLGDISKRVTDTLTLSDIIFAEDTRSAMALLNHLNIKKKIISYHKDNELSATNKVIQHIEDGNIVSLVSEAGMPTISDPGSTLIKSAIENNIKFEVVQGPVAFIHGLISSGFAGGNFYFHGFLPHKNSDKKKEIDKLLNINCPIIFYESPHRIKDTVALLLDYFPTPIAVSRELTKLHEETIYINTIDDIENIKVKGEFVVTVNNHKIITDDAEKQSIDYNKLVDELLSENISQKDITKVLKSLGMKRNDAYKLVSSKQI